MWLTSNQMPYISHVTYLQSDALNQSCDLPVMATSDRFCLENATPYTGELWAWNVKYGHSVDMLEASCLKTGLAVDRLCRRTRPGNTVSAVF